MDFQNRAGHKAGGGGIASSSDANIDQRERMRRLAMQTIDITKDPYFMKNHLGSYECRLCCTLHTNEGSYLAHTQGKKHQTNLIKRQVKDLQSQTVIPEQMKKAQKKKQPKIGRPGYRVTKLKDGDTGQRSILFEVEYKEVDKKTVPHFRIVSAFEQKIEAPDDNYQYVVFAAEPYENIAFKVPNLEVDDAQDRQVENWNKVTKVYSVTVFFRERKNKRNN